MRPSFLEHLGLYVALRWRVAELCRSAGRECEFVIRGPEPEYVSDTAIVVLRLVEDAVAYALTHGGGAAVGVEVQVVEDSLELLVRDAAAYPPEDSESEDASARRWIASERAGILGGACTVSSLPSGGSSMLLRIPLAGLEQSTVWPDGNAAAR